MPQDDAGSPSNSIPPFAALRAFEAVFRMGGVRKAAADLGISHAGVSRHITSLEDWLGQQLVTRVENRLVLTKVGSDYHKQISAALADIVSATNQVRGQQNPRHIRLCCIPGLAFQWLSGQLAEFERLHPHFSVELRPTDQPPSLLTHEADVDIRYYPDNDAPPPRDKGIKAFELARPDSMPVANPDLARRLNALPSTTALMAESLLQEDNDVEWRNWFALNGAEPPDHLPGTLCYHAHLTVAAARQGRGMALASLFIVGDDLKRGDLMEIALPGTKRVPLGSYMLFAREDRWSSPVMSTLRHFLRARAQEVERAA